MGHKINPNLFRVGKIKNYTSRWFSDKPREYLRQDLIIRKYIKKNFNDRIISKVEIERIGDQIYVTIFTIRPGEIIGKQGALINQVSADLSKELHVSNVFVKVEEVRRADTEAKIIAGNIALVLEKRGSYRYAVKKAAEYAMKSGAKGVKIICSGRLGGHEIANSLKVILGSIPSHTIRADIDYGFDSALTKYGVCGVKVWVYKGEVFDRRVKEV